MATQTLTSPISAEDKVFTRNKWIFSTSGIGRDLAYQLVSTFLLTYIQFGVSLNAAQFGVLYGLIAIGGKIWDGINDPMMGAIIEGSRMKWGKFKPWIVIGAVGCGATVMAMFNIRLEGWAFVGVMAVLYLIWESTFTMNDIGYWSMLASLSSDTKRRNSVTMLTVLFAGVGAIIAQGIIPMVTTGNMVQGYGVVAIIVALAYITSQVICGIFVKESPRAVTADGEKISLKKMFATIKKNDQVLWMTLSMLFYNIGSMLLMTLAANLIYLELGYNGDLYFYIVVAYGVTSVLINVFYTTLSRILSRKKLQAIAISVAIGGYLVLASIGWFSSFSIWIFVVAAVFISAGQSLFYMASIVNMTNCVEYNDYKRGERNEAVISTLRPFIVKLADAMKAGIVVIVLLASGIYGMSQSISGLEAQKSLFEEFSYEQKVEYVQYVQDFADKYKVEIETLQKGDDAAAYEERIVQLQALIDNHQLMSRTKLTPTGIIDVWNSNIERYTAKGDSAYVFSQQLGNIDVDTYFDSSNYYVMYINDSADLAFRDKAKDDIRARIVLRIVVTIVPSALLLGALFVQRKKFVINEEYYNMMIEEIAQRNANQLPHDDSETPDNNDQQ